MRRPRCGGESRVYCGESDRGPRQGAASEVSVVRVLLQDAGDGGGGREVGDAFANGNGIVKRETLR